MDGYLIGSVCETSLNHNGIVFPSKYSWPDGYYVFKQVGGTAWQYSTPDRGFSLNSFDSADGAARVLWGMGRGPYLYKDQPTKVVTNKYRRTIKSCNGKQSIEIDTYRIADAYPMMPAVFHAVKKLLMAGQRGAKDYKTDLEEAIVAIQREIEGLSSS